MIQTLYYKVLREGLTSALIAGEGAVQYPLLEWVDTPTKEQGYGLFVFRTFEDAEVFAHPRNLIAQCQVEGVYEHLPPKLRHIRGSRVSGSLDWPTGTVMVDRVRLTKIYQRVA